jgi:hypothetical protein
MIPVILVLFLFPSFAHILLLFTPIHVAVSAHSSMHMRKSLSGMLLTWKSRVSSYVDLLNGNRVMDLNSDFDIEGFG